MDLQQRSLRDGLTTRRLHTLLAQIRYATASSGAAFHGLRVGPNSALLVWAPQANSGVLVLTMAPTACDLSELGFQNHR